MVACRPDSSADSTSTPGMQAATRGRSVSRGQERSTGSSSRNAVSSSIDDSIHYTCGGVGVDQGEAVAMTAGNGDGPQGLELSSEFASVRVEVDHRGNGPRLRIENQHNRR